MRKKSLQILSWPGYLQIPWFLFYYSEFITTCICCIFYYYFFPLCFAVLSTSYSFPSFVFVYVLACLSPLLFCPHRFPNFLSSLVHWMAGKSSSLRFRVPAMPGWETGITRDPPVPSTSSPERSASRASDGRGGWHAAALDTNVPPRASYGWTPTPAIPGQKKWGMGGVVKLMKKKNVKKYKLKIAKTNVRRNAGIVGKTMQTEPYSQVPVRNIWMLLVWHSLFPVVHFYKLIIMLFYCCYYFCGCSEALSITGLLLLLFLSFWLCCVAPPLWFVSTFFFFLSFFLYISFSFYPDCNLA